MAVIFFVSPTAQFQMRPSAAAAVSTITAGEPVGGTRAPLPVLEFPLLAAEKAAGYENQDEERHCRAKGAGAAQHPPPLGQCEAARDRGYGRAEPMAREIR